MAPATAPTPEPSPAVAAPAATGPGNRVSILLRTYTRLDEAFLVIAGLARQTHPPVEFIVIDSGSSERVKAGLRAMAESGVESPGRAPVPLRLIEIPNADYQSARALNQAAGLAVGDLLAIISQDAIPADETYLERLVAVFDRPEVAGAYGRQTVDPSFSPLARKDLEKTYPATSRVQTAPDCWFVNTCSMVRRDLWAEHPFDEAAIISEDHEWAKWAQSRGHVVHYVSDAVVLHGHSFDRLGELWNRFYLEGKGLGYVHHARPGAIRVARDCLREIASDAVWLARNGMPHYWPMAVIRRAVKHAAFFRGFHAADLNERSAKDAR